MPNFGIVREVPNELLQEDNGLATRFLCLSESSLGEKNPTEMEVEAGVTETAFHSIRQIRRHLGEKGQSLAEARQGLCGTAGVQLNMGQAAIGVAKVEAVLAGIWAFSDGFFP